VYAYSNRLGDERALVRASRRRAPRAPCAIIPIEDLACTPRNPR